MTLSMVGLDGTYLRNEQGCFIAVGAHWVPAEGLHWPLVWDPESIRADFAKMRDLGFNTVRFDLFWAWFEPYPGLYNARAFEQLDYFIQLAHEYGIYLHPCLRLVSPEPPRAVHKSQELPDLLYGRRSSRPLATKPIMWGG